MKQLIEITGRHHMVLIHRVQNTRLTEMPILWLFVDGKPQAFQPLIDYFQHYLSRRLNWKRRAARAVGLFFDFSRSYNFDANASIRNPHSATLQAFIRALEVGTIPREGIDPSGLYWAPMSTTVVRETARHLDSFVSFASRSLDEVSDDHPLIALSKTFSSMPTDSGTMLRFLLTAKRLRSTSFLSYLKDDKEIANELRRKSRDNLGLEQKVSGRRAAKAMSLELVSDLLDYGFTKDENATALHEQEDITAKMIFLLLMGAGLRKSEPLQMWFNDITFPVIDGEERCIPALRHPSQAPTFIEGENLTRMQYLRQKGLFPRHLASGKSLHVGWKDLDVDEDTSSTEAFFIHQGLEQLFASYYYYYLNYRRALISQRKARGEGDHPFLFVSSGEDRAQGKSYKGAPYSQKAFEDAFERALKRVEKRTGQAIRRGKRNGTTPHALRHAYAMILMRLGAPKKAIQRAMHHRSILSQEVYTQPEWQDVNKALNAARDGGTSGLLRFDRPVVATLD